MTWTTTLGRRIRQLRRRRGLSQAALAAAAGLSRIYVAKLEAGERAPSLRALARIARALGVRLWVDLARRTSQH
jgi:transcriptional regulator with XRE-family HTH domain